jgi:GntR family transcriptional regulator
MFHIDKHSEVPVHAQLREQIIFQISTGELSIGHPLPSVRELARRVGVHHNSVSHVYAELVHEGWLVQRRGSRLIVVQQAGHTNNDTPKNEDLDHLIDRVIRIANERGFSLQQLAKCFRERLLAEPPDHLLIIEPEKELGDLIKEELRQVIGQVPESCSIPRLQQNPGIAIGSILVTPRYLVDGLECVPSGDRVVVPITYSPAGPYIDEIKRCSRPSVIGVLSISPAFLRTATGLLAPAISSRHTFGQFLCERPTSCEAIGQLHIRRYELGELRIRQGVRSWAAGDQASEHQIAAATMPAPKSARIEESPVSAKDLGVDVLFCDSITYTAVRHPNRIPYHLVSEESLRAISDVHRTLTERRSNPTSAVKLE